MLGGACGSGGGQKGWDTRVCGYSAEVVMVMAWACGGGGGCAGCTCLYTQVLMGEIGVRRYTRAKAMAATVCGIEGPPEGVGGCGASLPHGAGATQGMRSPQLLHGAL